MTEYTEQAKYLIDRFNKVWQDIFDDHTDYYSKIKDEQFPLLKNALSCINNFITLQVTADFVRDYAPKVLSTDEVASLMDEVLTTDVNANGFDVQYPHENPKFIAEIKCNIPVNKNRFGAKQIEGIIKDLNYLAGETKKTKSGCLEKEVKKAYRFMVIMEHNCAREAMQTIITSYQQSHNIKMQVLDKTDNGPLRNDVLYVVYVPPRKP